MGYTLIEKILSSHAGRPHRVGEVAVCTVDFCFSQDGTTSLVLDALSKIGAVSLKSGRSYAMVIDHSAPSPSVGVSAVHRRMRTFARAHRNILYDAGWGVSHQLVIEEGYAVPGRLILGADSHTSTCGALGCAAFGVGSTDLAVALYTGKNWFKVPPTIKIVVNGKIPRGIFSKDIILHIIGKLTANGATYKAVEFEGAAIDQLSLDERFTITNMTIEFGAKCGFMKPDKKVQDFFRKMKKNIKPVFPDSNARYEKTIAFDVGTLSPQIARPHAVDNVCSVEAIEGLRIQQGYIGTCTNGRLSDLAVAAQVLSKRRVRRDIRLFICPASRRIFHAALKRGYIKTFLDAGAVVLSPGCGPCVGTHQGIPADGEVVLSTANRNFKGRMGSPNAFIYLASPATVAYSCTKGMVADVRKMV